MFYGWRVVGVCFAGAVSTWGLGVFGASIYLSELTAAHDWSVTTVSNAITAFFVTNAVVLPLVTRSIDRFGPRWVISTGVLMLGTGVAALGLLEALWQLFAAFVCMGIGYSTMSVSGLSAAIAPWFERHQGRSVALALTGASVGAMVVVPLLVLSIAHWGFATAILGAAVVMMICMLPLTVVVMRFRAPAELGLGRDGDEAAADGSTSAPMGAAPQGEQQPGRSWRLWSVVIAFSLGLVVQVGFLTHHFALALPTLGAINAGWLVGATGLAGLVGRLLLARVIDRRNPRRYSAGIFAVQVGALGAIGVYPDATVLILGSLVYGFCLGQITTLSPIVVRREFGAEAFAPNYAVAGAVIQFCSAFGPACYGFLLEQLGTYGAVLIVAAAFECAAALIILLYRARA